MGFVCFFDLFLHDEVMIVCDLIAFGIVLII